MILLNRDELKMTFFKCHGNQKVLEGPEGSPLVYNANIAILLIIQNDQGNYTSSKTLYVMFIRKTMFSSAFCLITPCMYFSTMNECLGQTFTIKHGENNVSDIRQHI